MLLEEKEQPVSKGCLLLSPCWLWSVESLTEVGNHSDRMFAQENYVITQHRTEPTLDCCGQLWSNAHCADSDSGTAAPSLTLLCSWVGLADVMVARGAPFLCDWDTTCNRNISQIHPTCKAGLAKQQLVLRPCRHSS